MGIILLVMGCWPLIISGIVFCIACSQIKGPTGFCYFFGIGFVSFVALSFATYYYFATINVNDSSGPQAFFEWALTGLRAWTSLPAVASVIGWMAASLASSGQSIPSLNATSINTPSKPKPVN